MNGPFIGHLGNAYVVELPAELERPWTACSCSVSCGWYPVLQSRVSLREETCMLTMSWIHRPKYSRTPSCTPVVS